MFTSRLLILSVAICVTAFLVPTHADTVIVEIDNVSDEKEMEFSGTTQPGMGHDPGLVRSGSSDLELGVEGAGFYTRPVDIFQRVALRYQNIDIPAGSTINDAHIQFMVDEGDKTIFDINESLSILDTNLSIYGYLDPVTPANSPDLPDNCPVGCFALTDMTGGTTEIFTGVGSSITNVTAPVHWNDVPSWSLGPPDYLDNFGAAGPDQQTPDLAAIVQEIVDLQGWSANNSMTFIIDPKVIATDTGTGVDTFSRGNRTAVAFNCGPQYPERCAEVVDLGVDPAPPVLTIDFTPPGGLDGDFDFDDDVDGEDYLLWQLGGSPDPFSASDLALWESNFGTSSLSAATSSVVPEPSTYIVLLLATFVANSGRHTVKR